MSKINTSRCTIRKMDNNNDLFVEVKNLSENHSRQFTMNAYDKDLPTKKSLPIYVENELTQTDTLKPGGEKVYRIDASGVGKKVVFEIIQKKGGSGIKVSRNSKNPSSVVLHVK